MHWQEYVFFIGQMIFNIALIPYILSKDKPALTTSLITALVIFIYTFLYSTLSLWLTAIAVTTTGVLWTILAYQKYRLDRRKR